MRFQLLSALVGVAALAGCYKYAPTTLDAVAPNNKVKVMLSTEGELALEDRFGIRSRELSGQLIEIDDDSLIIEVATETVDRDLGGGDLHQRLDLPRSDVLRVDQRESDPARTGALVLVSAGGIAALVTFGVSSGREGDPGNEVPGPEDRRSSWIYRLPVRLP